jgi:uncharacterized protein YjbJ (UPF0337 family)
MNTDTLSGKTDQIKGQVKQSVGEAVGNQDLANSGTADQVKGNAKEAWGNVKDAFNANSEDAKLHAETRESDAKLHGEEAAHNVRQSVVNASEKIKDFVSGR